MVLLKSLKERSYKIKTETFVLYLALRDPRTPWYAKLFVWLVVAYAFSPIDLIPDFIPILGYLDDFILIPLGVKVAIMLIPDNILNEHRKNLSEVKENGKPVNWFAGIVIILIWIVVAILCIRWAYYAVVTS